MSKIAWVESFPSDHYGRRGQFSANSDLETFCETSDAKRMRPFLFLMTVLLSASCGQSLTAQTQIERSPAAASDRQLETQLPRAALLRLNKFGEEPTVYHVRFSPSGRLLATRDAEQVIRIWDMPSGRQQFELTGHIDRISSLVFSQDERFLVSASPGQNEQIHIWSMLDGSLLGKIDSQPSQVAMDKDGSLIAVGRNGFATYELPSGQPKRSRNLAFPKRFTGLLALNARCNLMAHMVSTQIRRSTPNEIYIRDLETGTVVHHEASINPVASVAIAPDGEHAAVCYRSREDGITLVSLKSDVAPFLLPNQQRETLVARFSPDGRILATASWDGVVRFWDVLTGNQIANVEACRGHALSVDFSSENRWIATTGSGPRGASTLVWDMRFLIYGIPQKNEQMTLRQTTNLIGALATRQTVEAYQAMGRLVALGERGLELAETFIDPLTVGLSEEEFDALVAKLNSESYLERQAAYHALLRVRRLVASRLRAAVRLAPTLEVETRLKKLLSTNAATSLVSDSEYRQFYRLIQVLELSGGDVARSLILKVARGHTDGRISDLAERALQRVSSRTESNQGV